MKEVLNIQFEAIDKKINLFKTKFSGENIQYNNHCKYFDHVIAKKYNK